MARHLVTMVCDKVCADLSPRHVLGDEWRNMQGFSRMPCVVKRRSNPTVSGASDTTVSTTSAHLSWCANVILGPPICA